jgi:predicted nucleic acid-binding protein
MSKAISNTSPLLYLYRIDAMHWLPKLFEEIWIAPAVANEIQEGLQKGYNVPAPSAYPWLRIVELLKSSARAWSAGRSEAKEILAKQGVCLSQTSPV